MSGGGGLGLALVLSRLHVMSFGLFSGAVPWLVESCTLELWSLAGWGRMLDTLASRRGISPRVLARSLSPARREASPASRVRSTHSLQLSGLERSVHERSVRSGNESGRGHLAVVLHFITAYYAVAILLTVRVIASLDPRRPFASRARQGTWSFATWSVTDTLGSGSLHASTGALPQAWQGCSGSRPSTKPAIPSSSPAWQPASARHWLSPHAIAVSRTRCPALVLRRGVPGPALPAFPLDSACRRPRKVCKAAARSQQRERPCFGPRLPCFFSSHQPQT